MHRISWERVKAAAFSGVSGKTGVSFALPRILDQYIWNCELLDGTWHYLSAEIRGLSTERTLYDSTWGSWGLFLSFLVLLTFFFLHTAQKWSRSFACIWTACVHYPIFYLSVSSHVLFSTFVWWIVFPHAFLLSSQCIFICVLHKGLLLCAL